ncbi:MAG: cohesin domain-containing protein [bacterium]
MKKYLLYLIITLLTVTDGCKCGSGGDNGAVTPSAAIPEVKIGVTNPVNMGDFSLTVDISDVLNAAGIYFRLYFDPKNIQVKDKNKPVNSVEEGLFFNQGGITTSLMVNFLDQNPDTGCLIIGLSRAGGKTGITGSGNILKFTFTTITAGTTSVKFTETASDNSLFTPELENISSVKWTNAEVIVK